MGAAGSRQPASPPCGSGGRPLPGDARPSASDANPGACSPGVSKPQGEIERPASPSGGIGGQPVAEAPMPSVTMAVQAACRLISSPHKEKSANPGMSKEGWGAGTTEERVPLRERRKARKTTHGLVRKLQRETLLLASCRILHV